MFHGRTSSQSLSGSWSELASQPGNVKYSGPPSSHTEEWIKAWGSVLARDLIDSRIVSVGAETSVEDACEVLLSEDISFLRCQCVPYTGGNQTYSPLEDLRSNSRADDIVSAARGGRVPVYLVNLSEKNPLESLSYDATVINLLQVFSRGNHRVLIQSEDPSEDYLGWYLTVIFFLGSLRMQSHRHPCKNFFLIRFNHYLFPL
ncbi:hypothetical protein BD779DRAFT_930695 [Infundibulicybe gibba]|nr:hypothetical protein BD779DRAFT_930695 [Infundibulicybe gibba]